MRRFLKETLHPDWYHGHARRPPFFEGWYFKIVDATEQHRYAIIPGVFLHRERPYAFVQVLNGVTGETHWHEFPIEQFWAADDRFEVHIGSNRFKANALSLSINRPEQRLEGELHFGDLSPWPVNFAAPGIMGWYAWIPLMECYHGIVSLDHNIYGTLAVDGQPMEFAGGRGYIEKDWGRSFPEAWIWMQSNHFASPGTSLTASIAIIPWIGQAFPGFIVGFWHEQRLYRLATYTGARTEALRVTDEHVQWTIVDDAYRLEIFARRGARSKFGLLKGPDTVEMGKRVAETLTASIDVALTDIRAGRVIFEGNGRHAGLEVHNVQERLLSMLD